MASPAAGANSLTAIQDTWVKQLQFLTSRRMPFYKSHKLFGITNALNSAARDSAEMMFRGTSVEPLRAANPVQYRDPRRI